MSKSNPTRAHIIERASLLFAERGYKRCSMSDVMAVTGLAKKGICRYFPSKEALATAALRHYMEEAHRSLRKGLSTRPDPVAKTEYMISRYGSSALGDPCLGMAMISGAKDFTILALARSAYRRWFRELISLLQEAKDGGMIKAPVDASALASTIMAALEGASVLCRVQRSSKPLDEVRKTLVKLLRGMSRPQHQVVQHRLLKQELPAFIGSSLRAQASR